MRDFFQKVREGYICIRKIALVYMYNIFDNYTIIQAIH